MTTRQLKTWIALAKVNGRGKETTVWRDALRERRTQPERLVLGSKAPE